MNRPVRTWLDKILVKMGSDSTLLGAASVGLVAAPFTPGPTLLMSAITEATYSGYARQSVGNPTVTFTGADLLEYVEGNTLQFRPTGSTSVNTIYGLFVTSGSDSATVIFADAFPSPIGLSSPSNQITITPRVGFDPISGNFGLNIVSN